MNRLFNPDSPIMLFLNRIADLIWLNLLTLLCCIPVVTAGAAFTALHYVSLKMVREEEGYLTRSFFKSFRENMKQATVIWILIILAALAAAADFYLLSFAEGALSILRIVLGAVVLLLLCSAIYWFPLLSRFENTIKNTMKNGFLIGISNFPRTICILLIYGVFGMVYLFFALWILPLVLMLGISLPVYLASYLFSGIFKKIEPEEEIGQSV